MLWAWPWALLNFIVISSCVCVHAERLGAFAKFWHGLVIGSLQSGACRPCLLNGLSPHDYWPIPASSFRLLIPPRGREDAADQVAGDAGGCVGQRQPLYYHPDCKQGVLLRQAWLSFERRRLKDEARGLWHCMLQFFVVSVLFLCHHIARLFNAPADQPGLAHKCPDGSEHPLL